MPKSFLILALSVALTNALQLMVASRSRPAYRAAHTIMQEEQLEEQEGGMVIAPQTDDGGPTAPKTDDGGPTMPVSSIGDKLKGFAAIAVGIAATGLVINYAFSPGSIFESPAVRGEPTANELAVNKYTNAIQQANQ